MYNWKYINCLKTKKYNGLESIKSIEDISMEVIEAVTSLLDSKGEKIQRMTRF